MGPKTSGGSWARQGSSGASSSGGQQKYLPSAPVQIIFERGITEDQMRAAIQARMLARPPVPGAAARTPRAPWASPVR
ncbi:MAG: hypothetical protein WAQ08_08345 [Aquabacterium sp.]|uniref:hypothetical protein n=1 Tax=Aquabacterium sp. TaxID=1872578 RepID=UPI003BAF5DEF